MTNTIDKSHQQRIAEQIRQYEAKGNMHSELTSIYTYWQQKYVAPRLRDLTGYNNHLELYARTFIEAIKRTGNNRIVSIGSGDGTLENQIAQTMIQYGHTDFRMILLELSPIQNRRALDQARENGISDKFEAHEVDLNDWKPAEKCGAIMAHHSLHHILELEKLFDAIHEALEDGGRFVTFDMIGRNGHMRWPEVYRIVNGIWKFLPEEKRLHLLLRRIDDEFYNHDCSTEGFEGIRAQDILPLLVERFHFDTFFAWGGLIDPFIDRGYSAHFDPQNPLDAGFIDFLQDINDILTETGYLKPTQLLGVMAKAPIENPKYYRGWLPETMVRVPS